MKELAHIRREKPELKNACVTLVMSPQINRKTSLHFTCFTCLFRFFFSRHSFNSRSLFLITRMNTSYTRLVSACGCFVLSTISTCNTCHLKLPWLESGEQGETKMTRKSLQGWSLSLFTHLAKGQKKKESHYTYSKFSFTVRLEIHQLVQY